MIPNLTDLNNFLCCVDSSVTTGVSAACLNTESVRRAKWWLDPRLEQQVWREAAELVAFDFFQPTLRSLGGISEAAKNLHSQPGFAESVREMLSNPKRRRSENRSFGARWRDRVAIRS